MYRVTDKLFHMIMEILNRDYFEELGYKRGYFIEDTLNKKNIEKRIADIIAEENKTEGEILFSYQDIKYDNLNNFTGTMLKAISRLNYTE